MVDLAEERQQDATRHAAETGAYHGARPFGFTLAHVNPDGAVHPAPKTAADGKPGLCASCEGRKASRYRTLVPDPAEAQATREAYELAAARISLYAICQYLDGHEIDGPDGARLSRPAIRTAQGHRWEEVGVASLIAVLRARRNIGKREWSKGWEGGKRPPGELHDAHWDAIIDEPLFDAVQKILDNRHKTRPGGNTPAHLLTGYSFGGFCGHSLRIHKVNGKRRYACNAWKSGGQCVSFEAEPAEREVELYLFKWHAKNTMLTKALEHTGNADLQKLYDKRRKLRDQRDELADKLSNDVIDDETYKRLKVRKDDQLAKIRWWRLMPSWTVARPAPVTGKPSPRAPGSVTSGEMPTLTASGPSSAGSSTRWTSTRLARATRPTPGSSASTPVAGPRASKALSRSRAPIR